MATWRCILLLVLGALVVECTQLDSQYSPTYVVCSGSCCPECLNGLQNPGSCGGRKCFSSHGAEYAIDNNLQTLWNSSAQYSNITSVSIGLTLDLGQERFGIQRIDIYGEAAVTELRISLDGVNFNSIDIVVNNEKLNKLEIEPALPSLGVPQARYIHLQFSDVELPEIAEVYILASRESGGFCVFQLVDQLGNITEQLRVVFQAFGSSQQIEMIQQLLRKFEEFIGKVETSIPGLQTTLEEKASLQTTQVLKFDTSQIYKELQSISSVLQDLIGGSLDINESICELETRVAAVSNELNSQLNVTTKGVTETREVSMSINEQTFASERETILMQKSAAEQFATNSYFYSTSIESINAIVTNTSVALETSSIKSLGLVATSVQGVISDSGNKSAILDALLMELEQSKENISLMILVYDGIVNDNGLALREGQALLNEVGLELMLSSIMVLISSLDNNITEYQAAISAYNECNPAVCTLGYIHAEMLSQNSSFILNVSLFTLERSRAFVDARFNLMGPFSVNDIRFSALLAQNISRVAINQFEDVGVNLLHIQSSLLQQTSFILNESFQLLRRAKGVQLMLGLLQEKQDALSSRLNESRLLVTNCSTITERLSIQANQAENTDQLQLDTEYTRNLTEISNSRVSSIDIDATGTIISDISTNTETASRALDDALIKFDNTELFINATRRAIDMFSANISAFAEENTRIIGEIDAIIASLGDIHTRVNMINSPVVLESSEEQDGSFLSLQPPLDRPLNDTIQFESIDLYFWTGPRFRTPTILFYTGPLCLNTCDLSDFFIILLENSGVISIQWRIGSEKGNVSQTGFQLGFSQLHIARVGASFEMQYGVSIGELGNPIAFGTIINDSILFTTSNRTAFLLGGAPNGLQLGSVMKDTYASFEGQIQQILFNGEQWGLWNIRSATDTTLYGEFQRNELATVNAWHASSTSTAAAISFDGTGYLYIDQFSSLSSFSSLFRSMDITIRPNDERDGLVLFAFDPQMNLSMEVFFQAGDLHLLIVRHDNNLTLVDYIQKLDSSIKSRRERELLIEFREDVGFQVNSRSSFLDNSTIFFNDLTKVKAWFGGINESAIVDMRFTPTGTFSGYFGCVDITVRDLALSNVFEGDHFISQYLNSPMQRGFSATCLQTVYASEVGFDGSPEAFLTYLFFAPVLPPNSPLGFEQNRPNLITFSFNSQRMEGIILVLRNREGDDLFVMLRNSFIEVRISLSSSGERFTLMSYEMVNLMEWHDVLLQFRSGAHELYFDGILQATYEALSTLNIQRMSVVPEDPDQPPAVFVGGIDDTLRSSSNESLPSFTGCIRDLTYSYEPFSFLSTSQSSPRYPAGVTYHSCPFLSTSRAGPPVLPVSPDQPEPNLCVPSPTITNTSLGSFHRQTQLNTSNIIGLLQRSWSVEVLLLYKADGHILSITTAEGYLLSLFIDNKLPKLILVDGEVSGPEMMENEPTELVTSCFTNSTMISCTLTVNDIQSNASFIEAVGSFTPEPPIFLGQTTQYNGSQVDSFVGCINSLSINRDTNGFNDLYTGQPCYNNEVKGIGFSGISLVEKEISPIVNEPLAVVLTFKPTRADGLLILLTTNNSSEPIFAAGLRNGRIHVSSLNGRSDELQMDICDPSNSTFSILEVKLENNSITVTSDSSITLPSDSASMNEMVTISIGNAPDNFAREDQQLLSFLLSEEVNQAGFLPGFIGCVSEVNINGVVFSDPSNLGFDNTQDILVGVCPL